MALTLCVAFSRCGSTTAKTWRLKGGDKWESIAADSQEQYLYAIAEIKRLVAAGDSKATKRALERLKDEFPDRVDPDLDLFIEGELHYWNDRYAKALTKYEKLLKDYPGSGFAELVLKREYEIGRAYLNGRKKTILGLLKISGYAEGVEIMERISDRAGLDEPNSVGLDAAIAVAEHYEQRERHLEAYLKWSEVASYWETGPVGMKAMYRMAEDNFAAYTAPPPGRRPYLDASTLTTAKTYYEKFMAIYPEEARKRGVAEKIKEINEQMSYKQLTIGQFYERTGKIRAAHLYFDMVIQNWPETEAARMARHALEKSISEESAGGK